MLEQANLITLDYKLRISSKTLGFTYSWQRELTLLVQVCTLFLTSLSIVHWLFLRASLNLLSCPYFRFIWSTSFYKLRCATFIFYSAFYSYTLSSFTFYSSFFLSS
jgi:hypothetical protein